MHLSLRFWLTIGALWACSLAACSDEGEPLPIPPEPTTGSLRLRLTLVASDDRGNVFPLQLGSGVHETAFGNRYTLTACRFIVSHVGLDPCDGNPSDFGDVERLDADDPSAVDFQIDGIERGHYCDLVFRFGLEDADNVAGSLPAEFAPMAWPLDLGGGYHFLQMEGEILDPVSKAPTPFTVSLGRLQGQSHDFEVTLTPHLNISREKVTVVELILDVNQWFASPHTLDLQAFTQDTRADAQLLLDLEENGADAFGLGAIRTEDLPARF